MIYLEEMLLRNGLIARNSDGEDSYVEGSLLSNNLVVRNCSTGMVEMRLAA